MPDKQKEKTFYGRRQGRPLSQAKQRLIDDILPKLAISSSKVTAAADLDPASLYSTAYTKIIFEIGFGAGEHLLELLRRHPDHAFMGAEPYMNGMASFLHYLPDPPPHNLTLWMDDAVTLAKSFANQSFDEIYILNPDPWHKARHHKRRIIRQETLMHYARILKTGGRLITSTDVSDLANWTITEIMASNLFEWNATCAGDWRHPPKDWIPTRYETKKAKGSDQMIYLFFTKK